MDSNRPACAASCESSCDIGKYGDPNAKASAPVKTGYWRESIVASLFLSVCGCQLPETLVRSFRHAETASIATNSFDEPATSSQSRLLKATIVTSDAAARPRLRSTDHGGELQAAQSSDEATVPASSFSRNIELDGSSSPFQLVSAEFESETLGNDNKLALLTGPADQPDQPDRTSRTNRTNRTEVPIEATLETNTEQRSAFPVDLPTILRLAGGRNWAVQLAWERINQAQASVTAADVLWLPNLNVGLGYTKHDGQIQATDGQVTDVSRGSLFVGGGAKLSSAPLTGGSGGPARLFVDLPIADALFQPLVQRQLACAAQSRHTAEFNDALRDAAVAYYELVAAQGEIAVTRENLEDAHSLLTMTEAFVAAGKASAAEVSRVNVIVANQQQALIEAELKLKLASTELIRLVRLDPTLLSSETVLFSADDHLLPVALISGEWDLQALIAQGQQARPEVAEWYATAQARCADARSEELRPFIPNLNVGVSGGGFGGGTGGAINNFDGRADVDALLVWEVRNLGFGEQAARQDRRSRYRQAVLESRRVQDRIAAEVSNAWHQVSAARQRMEIAQTNVAHADEVLIRNLDRIRGLEGLPLEAIQALNALSASRLTYLQAVVEHNKSQAELMRAIGRPISS